MSYWVLKDAGPQGPFTWDEFVTLHAAGLVTPETLYREDAASEWVQVADLADLLRAAAPNPKAPVPVVSIPALDYPMLRIGKNEPLLSSPEVSAPDPPKDARICTTCGFFGRPRWELAGEAWLEVLLWLVFLLPGFLYTVYRHVKKSQRCPSCGGTALVPPASPVGLDLVSRLHVVPSPDRGRRWGDPLLSGVAKLAVFLLLLILVTVLVHALTGGFH